HVPAMRIHQSEHYRALEFNQMGELLKRLRDPESNRFSFARPALELLILTAVRPGNVCTARWEHFHLESDQPTWVIPAKLMRKRRDHIVPLSSQTVQLLETIRDYNWIQVWLFPGSKDKGLSDGTLKRQLALLGYGHDQVHPHGFRSTFSTYANESGRWSRDAIE
ncbi:MAG: tyrosine-type recombinase/integrase, partial [SAR324 cluster bacterium]|nr:tyrosine-type recombinase/integrase [SAR324 cluster bacterium]